MTSLRAYFTSYLAVSTVLLISAGNSLAFDLVRAGKPAAVIVVPDQPLPVVKSAAEELQYHLQKATGAVLPIISESKASSDKAALYLGSTRKARELNLDTGKLPPNGFIIKLAGDKFFLLGDDGDGAVFGILHNNRTRVGTLFAVYEFLDKHLGVRWLWPGELGEVIPKTDTISVEKWDQAGKPFLVHSRWRDWDFASGSGWVSKENHQRFLAEQGKWLRRNRFALGVNLDITHAFTRYFDRYGKTHPDFFNLLPDGKRRSDPYYVGGADSSLISMCVSNPSLWKEIIQNPQHVRSEHPLVLDISENDTPGKCTCPNCLAWDVPDPEIKDWDHRMDRVRQAFSQGQRNWDSHLGSLSDRYAKFYLAVQKEAEKIDPKAVVMDHAYANHDKPPLSVKLNERVLLAIVPPMMYPCSEKSMEDFRRQWTGWRQTGAGLMLRPNYTLSGHDFPIFYARRFGEDFRFAAQRGLMGTDYDALTGQYAAQGPSLYMVARLNNRPDLTVEQVLDEYYGAFGPAARAIRVYFEYWEKVTDSIPDGLTSAVFTDFDPAAGGSWATFYRVAPALFTPQVMAKGRTLLTQAETAAKKDARAARRVAFLELGLRQVELTLAAQKGYRIFKTTGDLIPYGKALNELDDFRAKHEDSNMSNQTPLAHFERMTWDRTLVKLMTQPGREVAKTWKFMFDPKGEGEQQGWVKNNFDDRGWLDIGVEEVWQKQPVGKKWETDHKTPYHGVAWYRTSFTVTPSSKPRCVRLIFGSVDKGCTVWCNEKQLLHRPWPMPGNPNSWQEAFEVDASKVARSDQPNSLVVRVESTSGVGGIYRGVWLVESDPLSPASANLIRNGGFEKGSSFWFSDRQVGSFNFGIDSARSYHGKSSARITCTQQLPAPDPKLKTTSWGRWVQTNIPVHRGTAYRLKLSVKTSADFTGNVKVWITGTQSGTVESQLLNTNGIWREIVTDNIVPASNSVGLYVNLTDGTGSVWFDDVELSLSETKKGDYHAAVS